MRYFYDDPGFTRRLARAPAARRVHHAYVGGLLEQITEMLSVAEAVVGLYPDINADLLRAGSLLHAVGKTAEFAVAMDIDQTDEGRLLGHIVHDRSEAEWRVLDLLTPGVRGQQKAVAEELGITSQAVSKAVARAQWNEEHAARPAAARLLSLILEVH